MIPIEERSPRAGGQAWGGLITRARLRAYYLSHRASLLERIEDVVPEEELVRRVEHLDEVRPGSRRKLRTERQGGIIARVPVLAQLQRLRDELGAIREFCDTAAASFAELAQRLIELERRIDSLERDRDKS